MRRTRQLILEYAKRHGHVTVDGLAAELGVVPVTVRAHISALEKESLLKGEEVHNGRAGRPRIVYSLTEEAERLFPKSYDGLATRLLDTLAERSSDDMRALFEDAGARWSSQVSPAIRSKDLDERLNKVSTVLNDEGCDTEWEKQDGLILLRFYNCPYVSVVRDHPEVCSMEKAFLEKTLDMPVEIRQSGPGVNVCMMAAGHNAEA